MLSAVARTSTFAPRAARRSAVTVRASALINPDIKKEEPKVVDTLVVPTDLSGKPQVAMCRCWRSKTFPMCDGSHMAHNKDSGDNVGPLLVKFAKDA